MFAEAVIGRLACGVAAFDAFGYVFVAVVHFVDLFVAVEGFVFLAHALVEESELIQDVFFGGVHGEDFASGVAELFDGEVEHAFADVASAELAHGAEADVGIGFRFLEFGDGFAVFADGHELFAEFEAEEEVGGVAFDAFAGFVEEGFVLLLDEGFEFFADAGAFFVGVPGSGEPFFAGSDGRFDLLELHVGNFADEPGVGAFGEFAGVVIPSHGVGEVFFLFVEGGDLAGEVDAVGLKLGLLVEFGQQRDDGGIVFNDAVFLLHGDGFLFVFDEVAVVFGGIPTAGFHGVGGGGVFGAFVGDEVLGVDFQDSVEDGEGFIGVAVGEVEFAEFAEDFGVFRVALDKGLEGEDGGFKHAEGHGCVFEEVVGGAVKGVSIEGFFGHFEGGQGVFFQSLRALALDG